MSLLSDFSDGKTPFDRSGLKDKSISTRAQLFAAEAANISIAVQKYLAARPSHRLAPFSDRWMHILHREMFGNVWDWAGQLRTDSVNFGIRTGSPVYQISQHLLDLSADVKFRRTESGMTVIEQAVRLHHQAVVIHPFKDGNGRWSRMLANILLRQADWGLIIWPDEEIVDGNSAIRTEYIDALRSADLGDFKPLISLHSNYRVPDML